MFGFGHWEILIILVLVLIIFGAGKLPEIGAGLGKSIRNAKTAIFLALLISTQPR
jgi:sec-independent protein translocase protein TatA